MKVGQLVQNLKWGRANRRRAWYSQTIIVFPLYEKNVSPQWQRK
jgi:hypothetical protein